MTGYGPWYRSEIATGAVLGGGPVSSGVTWTHAANGSNWLNSYPAQLIPGSTGDYSKNEIASATTGTWPFRVYTRAQAVQRIWVLTIVGRSTEHNVSVSVQCGSGSTVSGIPVSSDLGSTVPITYVEDLVVQSAAVSNLTVNITPSGGYARLVSVSCYEQARVQLDASSSDHGVNIQSVQPDDEIYVPSYPTTIASTAGIMRATLQADARRPGLFYWSAPTSNPATRSGAYQAITGLGMPILTRKLTSGQTTGTVYWSAYAKVNAGNGDVQITTSHSAVSDSVNVTATSFGWTTKRAISVDCEDLSATDGRQASSWDEVTVNIRGNGGNTLSIAGFSIWEEP